MITVEKKNERSNLIARRSREFNNGNMRRDYTGW